MQIDRKKIKNILVVRNDRFGEFILNIPAIRALKETFSTARISLVVSHPVKELTESLQFVDRVIEWDIKESHTLFEKINFIGFLKKQRFDLAVLLNPSKEFNIFTYLSGIPVRLGYDRKWAFLLTHKLKDLKHLGQKHEVEYNLELVNLIGAKTDDKSILISIDQKNEIFIDNLLKKHNITESSSLVVLHPWTSDPVKQWPLDKFKELTRRLISELLVRVVIIGGKEEESKSKDFALISPEVRVFTGKLTLLQSAALLKRAGLLISNDSGPVHLAKAVNIPVVVIFRNDLPGKSAQRWGPWGVNNIVIEKSNLKDISVDEIIDATRKLLKL